MSNVEQRFHLILEKDYAKKYQPMVYGVYTLITMLFLVSNLFVIQPVYSCEDPNAYSISPKSAYLLDNHDGTYDLYSDGKYMITIDQQKSKNEILSSLPIK
ncbi:MAG TPA: hypothetical protein DDW34_06355 [Clostridium sp.]|nr:hypothetical protein [Clostridium sp.]